MANEVLRPGERLDDLLIGGLKIIQQADRFRFSLDAVLLAHFATVKRGAAAVDLGAGTGVLGLLLAARGAKRVTGVEISPEMADMARRSVGVNALDDRLAVVCADVRAIPEGALLAGRNWDLVVANPPYRPLGGGGVSPREELALARHELAGGLDDFVAAAAFLLKDRGRLAMVHLPERLTDVVGALRREGVEPKRLRLVHPAPGKAAKLLLAEGVRGGRPGLKVEPPLYVYGEDGCYSRELTAYYQAGE
ncbi:tRNA1(Val) (adenine(37)-N6)-methyltransferase [Anaeroselena agilis]|uniref:tRNA1(Val) (Adenine(37)-N6)-methyltransferase n=1 Tax=Anaeroselena agilis TaxID=3063788 RepID=A0ABU3P3S9_9FIRM|nr:tRNA1(Val) (adenine(37)-N6)-methyltransferase [Selenomonadales bacterium 4137-cl]